MNPNLSKTSMKVGLGEKIGYSLGDASANLVFQMMMIFQLKFYTDVFGLDGAIAGSVLLVARIVDAFIDPTVGILSDKTNTRWGKYRPWVLWTALPFAVFYVLAFYNPGIEDKSLVALYATISYVALMACYSFNNTPYSSLGGVMSSDIKERTSITSIRFVASTIAQFVVQGLTLPLVNKFGQGDDAHGWLCTIGLFASIGFVFLVITFFSSRERIAPPPSQKSNVKEDIKQTFNSVPWRSMFILTLFVFITLAMWGSAMSFYFQSNIDQAALYNFIDGIGLADVDGTKTGLGATILGAFNLIAHSESDAYSIGFSLFNMVGAIVQFLGVILLSEFLANRFGKKKVFIICLSLTAIFTALFYFPAGTDVTSIYVLCVLKSLAYAPTVPLLWAMIGDVADHVEYVSGRRATGFCFSGVVFALKAGLGVGGAFAGIILSSFGYVGSAAVQSESAIEGIRLVSSIVPGILFGIGVVALCFYPITKEFNEKMQAELTRRRAANS